MGVEVKKKQSKATSYLYTVCVKARSLWGRVQKKLDFTWHAKHSLNKSSHLPDKQLQAQQARPHLQCCHNSESPPVNGKNKKKEISNEERQKQHSFTKALSIDLLFQRQSEVKMSSANN